ncbi:uncharacterized protein LOC121806240 [Salvia splendens]|uniref:uncharacterized protein LOC121806240 n=1 Tax=Salvia splendens TaxID=180675 RepID=UPI001C275B6D|nr:uncharacterized protein LOC121806240 [Salvia splendens]
MATSIAAMTARRAATLARLSPSTRPASLVSRRGLAGTADLHGPPKINIWEDPMSPSKWKEEHFVIASLTGWFTLFYGAYKAFSGGKDKGEKVAETAQ